MDQREPAAVSVGVGVAPYAVDLADVVVMAPTSSVEVALLDRSGRIVAVNAAWERFCAGNDGDPARCGVGASYLDVCDADDDPVAARVGATVRAALRGELPAPLAMEVPCHAPDGWRWFDLLVSSRLGDDGGCVGATVTLSLARTETPPTTGYGDSRTRSGTDACGGAPESVGPYGRDRLGDGFAQTVMTLVPCALVLSDDRGRVIVANPQADALFGERPGGLLGRPLEALFPVAWDGVSVGATGTALPWSDAPFSSREAVGVRPDGRSMRIRMSTGPVPLWLGTGVLVVAAASDAAPRGATGRTADVEDLLTRLDSVVRQLFSAGMTLTGLLERLGGDEFAVRGLRDAIGELDGAVAEMRRAALRGRPMTG
jgi:PAS domain-containing protein